jgi:glycosyltransferase involved in cell wall biosynthesis
MRIAWTGSRLGTTDDTGAGALGIVLLAQVLERGFEVDLYHPGVAAELPESLRDDSKLSIFEATVRFEWDRWYSRNRIAAFISGSAARILTQVKLARLLVRNQRRRRYDAIFQFSQLELLGLGLAARSLPPIVVHPGTTSARELYWHRKESRYALQVEPRLQHYLVRALLHFRTSVQRRDLKKPRLIVGPSETFNRLLCEDYGVEPSRTRILRHPVDARWFGDVEPRKAHGGPVVLVYASRLSARKGLELVTALSHRLSDLAGEVEIKVLGGGCLWSDYSAHLDALNPALAEHIGGVPPSAMPEIYASADALLVPSHYEPGGRVVGEALAAGLPMVASDQVGQAEVLDRRVCRTFRAGDLDSLERAVRTLVAELRADRNGTIAGLARREAETHFAPEDIGGELTRILADASGAALDLKQPSLASA